MSCAMRREILADAADVGNLPQVGVHLLVAAYGEQHVVRLTVGVLFVAVDNLLCLVQADDQPSFESFRFGFGRAAASRAVRILRTFHLCNV